MPSRRLLVATYIFVLGSLGAVVPFLGSRLAALGFDGVQIGTMMAMFPVGRLLSAPLWAALADRYRMAGWLFRIGTSASFLGAIGIALATTPTSAALALLLFSIGRAPVGPLLDAFIVASLEARGEDVRDYGTIRLWGSVAFMTVVILSGILPVDPLWFGIPLLFGTTLLSFAFPGRGEGGPAPILPALKLLSAQPFLWPFLGVVTLHAMTLSVYDTFFSVHVAALGFPSAITSASVALGVAVEVIVMRYSRQLLSRLGTTGTLLLAVASTVPRWLVTGNATSPWLIVATQALHATSFAAFWLAGVQMMASKAPKTVAASAQSLFSAAGYGVGALAGALLAGEVKELWGTRQIFQGAAMIGVVASFLAWRLHRAEHRRATG